MRTQDTAKTISNVLWLRYIWSEAAMLSLGVEEVFGDIDDVLQVHDPAQHHLDWQRGHEQEQIHEHHVANEAHFDVEISHDGASEQRRHHRQIAEYHENPGEFADYPVRR